MVKNHVFTAVRAASRELLEPASGLSAADHPAGGAMVGHSPHPTFQLTGDPCDLTMIPPGLWRMFLRERPATERIYVRNVPMSRFLAALLAALLFGLVIVIALTEQNGISGDIDRQTLVLNVIAQVLLALGLLTYCGFAALHSTQHIACPQQRSMWLIATVALNVLGSCWYYVTIYQSFRKAGQGRLMRFGKARHA